jgi:Asp-tRNA(Asn)/Glu-tRNA(Gln) amidotransferase A subunit family amidase
LDGVPITVKDEIDVKGTFLFLVYSHSVSRDSFSGYKTYVGTSFLGDEFGVKHEDACVVERLKALGAIIIGKTTMYEVRCTSFQICRVEEWMLFDSILLLLIS